MKNLRIIIKLKKLNELLNIKDANYKFVNKNKIYNQKIDIKILIC